MAECREIVDEISRRVLVNPNMETYEYEIREESGNEVRDNRVPRFQR